jgi:2-amino-4-hydroxy-6-hydroxymethyldihydropteridine diphosphokinase
VTGLARLGETAAVSPLYETEPVGGPRQGPYLNAVVLLDTPLGARELLDGCLALEQERGRERRERWGPRTLDIDLLLYDGFTIDEPGLRVPHPRLTDRSFVVVPLLDVWPEATLPDGTVVAGVAAAEDRAGMVRLGSGDWWVQA